MDLVAVGTVADIVPLNGENRTLVKAGLEPAAQWSRQGLRSLAGAAGFASNKRKFDRPRHRLYVRPAPECRRPA